MDYSDEAIKKVINEVNTTRPHAFHSLYRHKSLIISALQDVLLIRAALRQAVRDEIKANGIAKIDGNRLDTNDNDELTHGEALTKWV